MKERFELAYERLHTCLLETYPVEGYDQYFKEVSGFLKVMCEHYTELAKEDYSVKQYTLDALKETNQKLYEGVFSTQYETSFLNPAYAVVQLGDQYGKLLSWLYTELRKTISYAYEQKLELFTIRLELFLEIYNAFLYEFSCFLVKCTDTASHCDGIRNYIGCIARMHCSYCQHCPVIKCQLS